MARLRKKTVYFEIAHGMNYQKCAKIQTRLKNSLKKRKSRSTKNQDAIIKKCKAKKTKKKMT